jgi:citrate synthase
MLQSIGKVENVSSFLRDVKEKKKILFGFGHRVYKNYDPRAKVMKEITNEVSNFIEKQKKANTSTKYGEDLVHND